MHHCSCMYASQNIKVIISLVQPIAAPGSGMLAEN